MNKYIHIIYGVYEHKTDENGEVIADRLLMTGDKRDLKDFLQIGDGGLSKILKKLKDYNGIIKLQERPDLDTVEIQPLYIEELEVKETRDFLNFEEWEQARKVLKE